MRRVREDELVQGTSYCMFTAAVCAHHGSLNMTIELAAKQIIEKELVFLLFGN
jgi:hypothetical protein